MASIQTFTNIFNGGFLRPNRYKVIVPSAGGSIEFLAKAASLPAETIGKCEVPYMGRVINLAGDRTYDDWNVTVINDIEMGVRTAIKDWMERIIGADSNVGLDAHADYYEAGAYVQQLTRGSDQPVEEIHFVGLFPISMGEVTLGFDQNDQVEEFEVTFAINFWE